MQTHLNQQLKNLAISFASTFIHLLQYCTRRIQVKKWVTRKLWLNVHLFLALGVGFIFAILGFTGSVCVYREALDELLNPQLVIEEVQGGYQSLDQIMASVRSAHPDRHGEWTLEMPMSANGMMTAWFDKPRETYFERYAPLMVSVNPYTAEVVASRFWGQTLTTWLLDLHTQLQFEQAGWNVVGYCGLLLMVSVCTGLYLWWPSVQNIRSAFKVKFRSGLMGLLFDLHRMMGLLSATALLLLAFTGFHLSFPSVLENLSGSTGMAHGETGRTITSTAIPNNHPTGLEAAEFIARGPFAKAELRRVTTPDGNSGVYRVNLRQKSEVNQRHPYTTVWVDRWSGQIKEARNPAVFSTGETLITWMWPLHTGEALGAYGRLCWFLAGQSLFFLYVSGLVRWLHRKGKIRDRAINFMALRDFDVRLKKSVYQLLLSIDRWMNVLAQKALPVISRMVVTLSKWLVYGFDYYQSKVRK
ncbi:PepSY-associated TM helix domain-containing protein [Methyloglobulus sp.]|uniref:PepSY-associated TM helix domain-containing protein n=1 Tax=Methyloglobulus sp. TaxID=2518622 RepID=UPI0032B754CF